MMMTLRHTPALSALLTLSLLSPLASSPAVAQVSSDYVNILETRLQAIEQQVQNLTAQIEQTAYQSRETAIKLDKLQVDIDTRFRMLGDSAAGGAAPSEPRISSTPMPGADRAMAQIGRPTAPTASATERHDEALAPNLQDQKMLGQLMADADGNTAPAAPLSDDPVTAYDQAFSLIRDGDYESAESAMRGFIKKWPKHDLTSNASYWLGETYYVRGDFKNAAKSFAECYQKFPKGGKAEDTLLKLGLSLAQLGRTKDACLSFAQLKAEFPKMSASTQQRVAQEQGRLSCEAETKKPASKKAAN
jgi:tol-pal system protein YbgF